MIIHALEIVQKQFLYDSKQKPRQSARELNWFEIFCEDVLKVGVETYEIIVFKKMVIMPKMSLAFPCEISVRTPLSWSYGL